MGWVRRGTIPVPIGQQSWSASHAQCPIPHLIDETTLRIYFSTRDARNRTRPSFIEVDPAQPERILRTHDQPLLELGVLGCFDDAGVMPSCLVSRDDDMLMYYAGWTVRGSVPYHISIGVAASEDGGITFRRISDEPILDRSPGEPHFCSTPFVLHDGPKWRMWYLSCLNWIEIDGRPEPRYCIRMATSNDGLNWERHGDLSLPASEYEECQARPWVVKSGNLWEMYYCSRSRRGFRTDKNQSYRIRRATSADGLSWACDEGVELDTAADGWDSEMTAYPSVYEHRGVWYLLYNGNEFGRYGFGHAVWEGDR